MMSPHFKKWGRHVPPVPHWLTPMVTWMLEQIHVVPNRKAKRWKSAKVFGFSLATFYMSFTPMPIWKIVFLSLDPSGFATLNDNQAAQPSPWTIWLLLKFHSKGGTTDEWVRFLLGLSVILIEDLTVLFITQPPHTISFCNCWTVFSGNIKMKSTVVLLCLATAIV